jgi:sugar lactone lactonase YvrE
VIELQPKENKPMKILKAVFCGLCLLFTQALHAQNKIYWTDEGTNKIQRANLDGSSVEDLVTGLVVPVGIALDLAAGKMYWTEFGSHKIQRANLDGSSVEELITGLSFPFGIALDPAAGKMYWTNAGSAKIQRANLDGSSVEDLVTTGLITPRGIALDIAAGKMYWTDTGTDKIQRANLDGSSVEDLVTGLSLLRGIALDLAAGKMYWTNAFFPGKIQRANFDGSSVEDLVTGLSFPFGIALDLAAGKMYWTDEGTNKIQRANLDGSSVENLVTGIEAPLGIALDVTPPVKPFVFLANKVTLKRTKQSTPSGDIHSNGTLTVEKGDPSTYNSNLTAVGKITIQKDNTINGDVTSATSISNSGTINGTAGVGAVDTEDLPSLSYSAGGLNKTVPSGGSLAVAPGSYNIVTLNSGGTLKLSSGEYFMNELRYSGSEAVIEIDLSSGEPVTINVVSNLQLGKEAAIQLVPNGESDSKIVTFNTLQTSSVSFGKEAYLLGSFNAPNAKVTLVKNSQLRGSICAKEILVERDCLFLHHDSPGSLPGPGNLPKSPSDDDEQPATSNEQPVSYQLEQNYPNPFNPSTVISFQLPVNSEVTLSIFNTNGQLVKKLVAGEMNAGRHSLVWDATNDRGERVASGVYLYVLKAGEFTAQRKLVVMK